MLTYLRETLVTPKTNYKTHITEMKTIKISDPKNGIVADKYSPLLRELIKELTTFLFFFCEPVLFWKVD